MTSTAATYGATLEAAATASSVAQQLWRELFLKEARVSPRAATCLGTQCRSARRLCAAPAASCETQAARKRDVSADALRRCRVRCARTLPLLSTKSVVPSASFCTHVDAMRLRRWHSRESAELPARHATMPLAQRAAPLVNHLLRVHQVGAVFCREHAHRQRALQRGELQHMRNPGRRSRCHAPRGPWAPRCACRGSRATWQRRLRAVSTAHARGDSSRFAVDCKQRSTARAAAWLRRAHCSEPGARRSCSCRRYAGCARRTTSNTLALCRTTNKRKKSYDPTTWLHARRSPVCFAFRVNATHAPPAMR